MEKERAQVIEWQLILRLLANPEDEKGLAILILGLWASQFKEKGKNLNFEKSGGKDD